MGLYDKKEAKSLENLIQLSGKDNKTIKAAAKLSSSASLRRESGEFLLEGARLCLDAVLAGTEIKRVFVTEKALKDYKEYVEPLLAAANEKYLVSADLFAKLSDTVTPQGVAAVCKMPKNCDKVDSKGMYIALENMQDPSNLGAVARTAEALGISGIIISKGSADPYSPKAQRSAMGSLLRLPVIVSDDFLGYLKELKAKGMTLFATIIKDYDVKLGETEFPCGSIVMIGNEGNGLTSDAISSADKRVTISMSGRNESLNASVAASLFMWEMMKGKN